jgi:ATP-dependent Clp protease ATP-binding subunit ClpA
MKGQVLAELRARFRPEFLNRIDKIVGFGAITRYLEPPLAREIMAGHIPDGSTIDVATQDDHLIFSPVIEGEMVDAEQAAVCEIRAANSR